MEFRNTRIAGLVEVIPKIYHDDRGFFLETFHLEEFAKNGISKPFLQANQSFSKKGVLRGLHFQNSPFEQGKLVRVVLGKVLDVVVDLRPNSPTFGQHEKFILSAETSNMVYVPEGFAHGFYTIEDAVFSYKCTNVYNKASEQGIIWNDPTLNIDWGVSNPTISDKDLELITFDQFNKVAQV